MDRKVDLLLKAVVYLKINGFIKFMACILAEISKYIFTYSLLIYQLGFYPLKLAATIN